MATRMNTTQPAPNTTNAANSLCDVRFIFASAAISPDPTTN